MCEGGSMLAFRWGCICVVLLPGLSACERTPRPPSGTGAQETVRSYFEGIIQQNWQQAYSALDPASKKRTTLQAFTGLAQTYRRNLGFNPEELRVQSCDE